MIFFKKLVCSHDWNLQYRHRTLSKYTDNWYYTKNEHKQCVKCLKIKILTHLDHIEIITTGIYGAVERGEYDRDEVEMRLASHGRSLSDINSK